MHIFLKNAYDDMMPEALDTLRNCINALQNQSQVYRLYQASGGVPTASTLSNASNGGKPAAPTKTAGGKSAVINPTAVTISPDAVGLIDIRPPAVTVEMLPPQILNEKLLFTLLESLAAYYMFKEQYQELLGVTLKACVIEDISINNTTSNTSTTPNINPLLKGVFTTANTVTSAYLRRKLVEVTCQATAKQAMIVPKPGSTPTAAAATAVSALKFDSVLLNVYAALALAELGVEMVGKEAVVMAVDKANKLVEVI